MPDAVAALDAQKGTKNTSNLCQNINVRSQNALKSHPGAKLSSQATLGAKMGSKSMPKRDRNLRAKKGSVGSDLDRFWVVSGGVWGGKNVDFSLGFRLFLKNTRFRC